MIQELYIFRHGQAKAAQEGQDDKDRGLDEVGIEQAKGICSIIEARGGTASIDKVISSDTIRTFETALIASDGGEPEQLPALYKPHKKFLKQVLEIFGAVGKNATAVDYINNPRNKNGIVQEWVAGTAIALSTRLNSGALWKRALVVCHMPVLTLIGLAICTSHMGNLRDRLLHTCLKEGEGVRIIISIDQNILVREICLVEIFQ